MTRLISVFVYKRRAARPAAAIKTGAAVCIALTPLPEVVLVAALAADVAASRTEDRTVLRPEAAVLIAPEADDSMLERAPDAVERAPEAFEVALEAAEEIPDAMLLAPEPTADPAAPKMVVEPMMEVKTEDPSVTKDSIAEVVRAADPSDATLLIAPAAPAKMVVEPMMEVMTDDPSVISDSIAEVVMADPRAPPALVEVAAESPPSVEESGDY